MKKYFIIFLKLCIVLWFALECNADNNYIYPQWWGAELKAPGKGDYTVSGSGLYTKDNNFYIMYSYYPDDKTTKIYLYDFFNDNIIAQWTRNRKTDEYFSKQDGLTLREYITIYGYTPRFQLNLFFGTNKGNSDFIFDDIGGGTGHCDDPMSYGFSMKSLTNSTEYRKQFFYIKTSKMLFKTSNECTIMDGRSKAYIQSKSAIVSIYSLDDGTYLLVTFQAPFIIRIKPDASSPFIASREDVFLVDFDWMHDEYHKIYSDILQERNKPPFPGPIYLLENIDARITEKLKALK